MGGCKACQWIVLLLCLQGSFEVKIHYVDITYVKSAVEKWAVCLDGSPQTYHLPPSFGAGVDRWLIQLDANVDGDEMINYVELFTYTMHANRTDREYRLCKAFEYFDKNNNG